MMTERDDLVSARDVALAVGLGALAGVRAALPNALLSQASARRRRRRGGGFLSSGLGSRILALAGLLELVGDKLPQAPARVDASPRLARIGSGGLAAAALGRPRPASMAILALAGGVAAALSTTLSYRLRRGARSRWGMSNVGSGLLEDAVVLGAAALLLPRLSQQTARLAETAGSGLSGVVMSAAEGLLSKVRQRE